MVTIIGVEEHVAPLYILLIRGKRGEINMHQEHLTNTLITAGVDVRLRTCDGHCALQIVQKMGVFGFHQTEHTSVVD